MALQEAPFVNVLGDGTTSTPVPTGSQIGDGAIIITSASIDATLGAGADQFTEITLPGGDPGCKLWIGTLTSLDPIGITLTTGSGVRSAHAQLVTVRGQLQADRLTSAWSPLTAPGAHATLAALPGSGGGAVVVASYWGNIGGSSYGGTSGGATWVGDTEPLGRANSTYHGVASTWTPDPTITGPVTVDLIAPTEGWLAAVMVGVLAGSVAPPCRLFPREDGLGVGGGRIYPPPRSQQRSGRRFGYY